jgi:hypothetical protein
MFARVKRTSFFSSQERELELRKGFTRLTPDFASVKLRRQVEMEIEKGKAILFFFFFKIFFLAESSEKQKLMLSCSFRCDRVCSNRCHDFCRSAVLLNSDLNVQQTHLTPHAHQKNLKF